MTSKAFELAKLGNAFSDGALSNRNLIINGSFDIWQRGEPITNNAGTSAFNADRWRGYSGSSRTFTKDETSALSIGFKNCLKAEIGSANASFYQRIEDVRTLAGSTVTLSYYVKSDASHTPVPAYFTQYFGSGGSSDVTVSLPAPSITTDWQRITQTVTLPSVEGKTIGDSSFLLCFPFTMVANRTYYLTGVQLEVGDTATPFEHEPYGVTLQKCQRYYESFPKVFSVDIANSTSSKYVQVFMSVEKRTTPTVSYSSLSEGTFANRTDDNKVIRADHYSTTGYALVYGLTADAEL